MDRVFEKVIQGDKLFFSCAMHPLLTSANKNKQNVLGPGRRMENGFRFDAGVLLQRTK